MAFKVNVSDKGKAIHFDTDNEELIGITFGSVIDGKMISTELEGYELVVKGSSDKAGFPGIPAEKGPTLKRVMLKKGIGMKDNTEGLRLRKTVRGNEISADTVQINTIVKKEGAKKFESLIPVKAEAAKK
jgi:small subunit ribosomal protein S6e